MTFYTVTVYMGMRFHDDYAVMETEITVAAEYQFRPMTWLRHPYWDSPVLVWQVGYDAKKRQIAIALGEGGGEGTYDQAEWLEGNKHWKIAKHPCLPIAAGPEGLHIDRSAPPIEDDGPQTP
jgi:hypothetical protein